jgi:hypothetical protein
MVLNIVFTSILLYVSRYPIEFNHQIHNTITMDQYFAIVLQMVCKSIDS